MPQRRKQVDQNGGDHFSKNKKIEWKERKEKRKKRRMNLDKTHYPIKDRYKIK